ncbi:MULTISPECIES: hypothetical protein [unclassified Roseitalea]|uniref:hypothetical protein n=1 Tax=unclassified Roseitalea TaxID=2639107 RepID=UPI00273EB19F|nr:MULTISPECIES: hypothetical protein [unclassified Roseitalea]
MTRFAVLIAVASLVSGCTSMVDSVMSGRSSPVEGRSNAGQSLPNPPALRFAEQGARLEFRASSNGQTIQRAYVAAAPDGVEGRLSAADGSTVRLVPGCWGCSSAQGFDEKEYATLWPLQIGKTVTFNMLLRNGAVARQSIIVAEAEPVTVGGVRYQAVVLRARVVSGIDGSRYRAERADWWVPEIGWIARSLVRDTDGNLLQTELVSYQPPVEGLSDSGDVPVPSSASR